MTDTTEKGLFNSLANEMLKMIETDKQAILLLRRCYYCEFHCGDPSWNKCSKCITQRGMAAVNKKLQYHLEITDSIESQIKKIRL